MLASYCLFLLIYRLMHLLLIAASPPFSFCCFLRPSFLLCTMWWWALKASPFSQLPSSPHGQWSARLSFENTHFSTAKETVNCCLNQCMDWLICFSTDLIWATKCSQWKQCTAMSRRFASPQLFIQLMIRSWIGILSLSDPLSAMKSWNKSETSMPSIPKYFCISGHVVCVFTSDQLT